MTISDSDFKILWGRAAGICSFPGCDRDLTIIMNDGKGFNIGEMAHIIAHQPNGPRGVPLGGSDGYENLILMCPTHHTLIDKELTGIYTAEIILQWKNNHELKVRNVCKAVKFANLEDLKSEISHILDVNKAIWQQFGPQSLEARINSETNTQRHWQFIKLASIIPNNRRIINLIESNFILIDDVLNAEFVKFKIHADSFERNQYTRLDKYPLFPKSFEEAIKNG